MTDVVLFCRPDSYKAISMDVYANNLFEKMRNLPGFRVKSFKPLDLRIPLLGKYLTLWMYYPRAAKRQQADINHILDHSISHLIGALDAKKTVITCHDLIGLKIPKSTSFWKRRIFWNNITRNMVKARKIIAVSQSTKNDILKFTSYKSGDIVVIYEGIGKSFKQIEKDIIEERFGFKKPTILHVGHNNLYKNVEGLIKAISLLGKDIKLVKVGPISRGQFKLLKKLKIDFVQFLDLSEEELMQVYNAVDLLVYPSWHEGFGLSVLEAMASGCPVICSNIGALLEVTSEAAIKIAPDDISSIAKAIKKVLENPQLRQELIGKGFRQAGKFNWEDAACETAEVYKSILS